MNVQASIIPRLRASRLPALLALAALVLLQASLAGHEASHALADIGEACHACVQLDSYDAPVETTAGEIATYSRNTTKPAYRQLVVFSARAGTHSARAPPLS